MDPAELKPYADFMKEHGLAVLLVEKPGFRLNLVKEGAEPAFRPTTAPGPAVEPGPADGASRTPAVDPALVIRAPLVGTFYRSPSPEAKPFIEVGQQISKDDVLCIIEAMKVLNQVKSECEGTIAEILVENGSPVEFGQPLFRLEPGGG